MVMFVWGAKVFFDLYRPPAGAMEIYVVGKQWMWKVQHMDGQREINELHVPVGRPVKLIMGSEDVHPQLLHPGVPREGGRHPRPLQRRCGSRRRSRARYHLFCAEYCGTKHSGMIGSVIAMEPADFQAWLGGGRRVGVAGGRAARSCSRTSSCITCHRDGRAGPRPGADGPLRQAGRAAGRRRR